MNRKKIFEVISGVIPQTKNEGDQLKKRTIADIIKMLDADKIVDMNISNIPLEDIITQIYKGDKVVI